MNVLDFNTINISYPEPYLGLNPFSEKDEPFFFGRDQDKIVIARNLKISRLTVLFGESGVGKSSVLQAGVVPQLNREAENNRKEYGFPSLAVVVCSDWHEDPLSMLTKQIHASVAEAIKIAPQSLELKSTLAESIAIWTEKLAGNKKSETRPDKKEKGKLLIILDQFEEYFWHRSQESETKRFVDEFSQVVNHPDLRVNFLIAIRHDSLAKLKSFQGRILNILDNLLELKRLDRQSAKNAIVKPLGEHNIRRIITEKLIYSPLTLLSAESGMGKTSILNKGVTERRTTNR